MRASIIVRTYNEAQHLPALLERCRALHAHQDTELLVVDSGSTDATVPIAERSGARVLAIDKAHFTFGRSLNIGCEAARGEYLVFISGHCRPVHDDWVDRLLAPLESAAADYAYGRQVGDASSRFSECQLFGKYYPEVSRIPQAGFFCNNANAALPRAIWREHPFDEGLTGLEDMELAKRLVDQGRRIAYVADAAVVHLHQESWHKVRMRFEREAIALQRIMPGVHVSPLDFLRYFTSAVALDFASAWRRGELVARVREIVMFRLMQYWGTFRGNREHRRLSAQAKEEYFYPK